MQVLEVAVAMVSGLEYLHREQKAVHRDVKPSNVLLNSLGQVKLCDLGVAGELEVGKALSYVGTQSYMSPERLKGEEYGEAGDVWALGITLLELALGRHPIPHLCKRDFARIFRLPLTKVGSLEDWPAGTEPREGGPEPLSPIEYLASVTSLPPPQLPSGCLSADLTRLVNSCLAKEPRLRPSAQQLLATPLLKEAAHLPNAVTANWYNVAVLKKPPRK